MFLSLFTNKNKGPSFHRTPFFSSWDYQSVRPDSGIIVSTKTTRQTGVIDLQYHQAHVEFDLPLANSNLKQIATDKVSFVTSQKNIEPQYQTLDDGIKENIILHQIPSTNEFFSILKTTNADLYLTTDNLPVFLDPKTGQHLLRVEKPYAFDAKGNKTYSVYYQILINNQAVPNLATTTPGIFNLLGSLTKIGHQSSYQVILKIDPRWLFDKSRVYPITVDPSVTVIHQLQSDFVQGSLNRIKDTGTGNTAPNLETSYQELINDQTTVGLWHFNETIGSTYADASGLGNTATATGNVSNDTITPKLGTSAVNIGDTASYLTVGDNDGLSFTAGKFTIETWFKSGHPLVTADDRHYLISKGNASNYEYGINMSSSGKLTGEVWTGIGGGCGSVGVTGDFGDNQWHHLAFTADGNSVNFYVDGKLLGSGVQTCNPANGTAPIIFGRRPDNPAYYSWSGELDETRISNIARSVEQIKADAQRRSYGVYTSPVVDLLGTNSAIVTQWNYLSWTGPGMATGDGETLANSTGLVAQWNFNETSGLTAGVAAGSCGVGCSGALTNFASTGSQDAAPGTGWTNQNRRWGPGALSFDGVDDYVNVPSNSSLSSPNISVETWIKPNSMPAIGSVWRPIVANGDYSSSQAYSLGYHTTNGLCFGLSDTTYACKAYTPNNTWTHVVGTYDGANIKLYINSVLVATTARTGAVNSSQSLYIGGQNISSNRYFSGIIDSTRIYSRALTASEILSNYNAANIEFQTRSSPDGINWEAWKGAVGDSQIDSGDATNDYWSIDTNPNSDSTASKTGTINVGSGADGACTISSGSTNLNTSSCAGRGTADAVNTTSTVLTGVGATGITVASTTGLSVGNEVLIINLQGTTTNYDSVGKYEVHIISSINGATLTFSDYPIKYNYDGTTQKIMVQRVPNYTNVTIGAGATMTISAWNGVTGGVLFFKANGAVTNNGSISTDFKGYRGAPQYSSAADYVYGYIGESEGAAYQTIRQQTGIGTGGGAGQGQAGGGGGGYNSPGIGGVISGCVTGGAGTGGSTAGNSPLEAGLRFGGSGGASGSHNANGRIGAAGGNSGGIISILANSFTSPGIISSVGATGQNGYAAMAIVQPMGGGGGGAGGTVQIKANTVSVSGSLNVFGGTGGSSSISDNCTPSGRGGNAGTGRISIYYSNSYTSSVSLNTTNVGTGNDGECSVPGSINLNTQSCSGRGTADAATTTSTVYTSAGSNSIAVASSAGMAAGDEVLIINLQGTSSAYDTVGRYETVTISSVGGNTLYFTNGLVNSYDGTTQKIMVQRVPNYTNVTINAGSILTTSAWNGSTGGVIFFRVKGTLNNAGTVLGTGLGYRGGGGYNTYSTGGYGTQGESYRGLGGATNAANAGGGGGGYCPTAVDCWSQGGGGASSANGTAGGTANGTGGSGGIAYAGQSTERLNFGSAGGGGADTWSGYSTFNSNAGTVGTGGNGGGIVFISAANINNTGSFTTNGTDGSLGNRGSHGGGGGGGGDQIINNLNSFGALSVTAGGNGGAGGAGLAVPVVVNPPPASSVQKTGSLIKQEGSNSIRLDAGVPQADSATVGLWHLDETGTINSPTVYTFTGDTQTYTVPAGVTSLVVKAWGGGGGGGNAGGWTYGFPGGGGGYATGTISVTPGQVLYLVVGAGGTNGTVSPTVNSFGGGGYSCTGADCRYGGQGGGRSAIRIGSASGTEVLTAAGAGGGGSTYLLTNDMRGGAGGGATGQTGFSYGLAGVGGGGGNPSSGGSAGTGSNYNGTAGSQFQGGSPSTNSYGGGGGGGYYGGGGGAYTGGNAMGGGGGGSSYIGGVSGGATSIGSGSVPGNPSDPYITNITGSSNSGNPNGIPAGTGGAAGIDGNPGKIVIFAKDSNGNVINTITDSSEYHQTAAISGTSITTGVVNKGRNINGGNISINNSPSLNPTTITMEAWEKSLQPDIFLLYKYTNYSPYPGYALGLGSSKADCYLGGSGGIWVYGTSVISDGKWHHVACSYDGTTAKLYVDGKLEGSGTASANLSSKINLNFGWGSNVSLDEVRISNIARTPEEIEESYRLGANHRLSRSIAPMNLSQNSKLPFQIAGNRLGSNLELMVGNNPFVNYEPDANTVGLWHLDEPDVGSSGSPTAFIKDATGNGNNATPGVGSSYPTSVTGKIGLARSFNGTSNYINTASDTSTSVTNSFSIGAWIKLQSAAATNSYIFTKRASTGDNYALIYGFNANKYEFYSDLYTGTAPRTALNTNITDNNWHYVVWTYNGTSLSGYLDGNLDVTVNKTFSIGTTLSNFRFGASNYVNGFFNGSLDEVRVDNVARSAADIRAAYDYGSRTHQVTIDFKAKPDASGIGANALSFNLDETPFGASSKLPHLFSNDKLIVQENIGGTEYLAQGPVSTVNSSSGAVTMTSWDVGSSFPLGGFTPNATVFKWQQEYFDLRGALPEQKNNISRLTMRVTDGSLGGSYWLDDFRTVSNLMNISIGSSINSTFNRYFQYRAIESTSDTNVSAALQQVSFNYLRNYSPNTPTLVTPVTGTTNLQSTVSLGTSSTDLESDFIRYKITICTDPAMSVGCTVYDQTASQIGWSGQNTQANTAYTSGSVATLVVTLPYNATYYWKSIAIDPAGSNLWSGTQTTPSSFATSYSPVVPSLLFPANGAVNQSYILSLGTSTSDPDNDPIMYKLTLCTDAAMSLNCQVFDQTTSQIGWSGQNTGMGGTSAYTSGTVASYTLQIPLSPVTHYYWKSQAIDPTGSHLWGATQTTPFMFTTAGIPLPPTNCIIQEAPDDSYLKLTWNNHAIVLDGFTIQKNVDDIGYTDLTVIADPAATNYSDTSVPENHTYQYRVRAYIAGPYYSAWCESPKLNLGGILPTPTPTPPGPTPTGVLPTSIPENGILIY